MMSSQTHSWPRNNINIFKKDTYKYEGGHSLLKCLILPVHQVFEQMEYSTN